MRAGSTPAGRRARACGFGPPPRRRVIGGQDEGGLRHLHAARRGCAAREREPGNQSRRLLERTHAPSAKAKTSQHSPRPSPSHPQLVRGERPGGASPDARSRCKQNVGLAISARAGSALAAAKLARMAWDRDAGIDEFFADSIGARPRAGSAGRPAGAAVGRRAVSWVAARLARRAHTRRARGDGGGIDGYRAGRVVAARRRRACRTVAAADARGAGRRRARDGVQHTDAAALPRDRGARRA